MNKIIKYLRENYLDYAALVTTALSVVITHFLLSSTRGHGSYSCTVEGYEFVNGIIYLASSLLYLNALVAFVCSVFLLFSKPEKISGLCGRLYGSLKPHIIIIKSSLFNFLVAFYLVSVVPFIFENFGSYRAPGFLRGYDTPCNVKEILDYSDYILIGSFIIYFINSVLYFSRRKIS